MIKVEGLTRTYGAFTAVDDVGFEIGQGEIVGLLGHNGAGKTTIMKMLTGYLEPSAGHIEIDGLSLSESRKEVQARIGYLPENCPIYPELSVIDYLRYAAALHGVAPDDQDPRVVDAIRRTDLAEKAADLIQTLSRGYRQRVGVAQAILHRPAILILDEPTNGLDPTQIHHMRDLIRSLSEQATVILSTHILQEVEAICDRALIIRKGRKVVDATLSDLREARRIKLRTSAPPDGVLAPFGKLEGIADVQCEPKPADAEAADAPETYHFALQSGVALDHAAAQIAKYTLDSGHQLYELRAERRDLETIFGELSQTDGGVAHE